MAEEEEFRLAEAGQKSPPEFSASYDKARKAYSLSSALLLAWALIGIDVDDKPIEKSLKSTFKSPQAVPDVLIALVIYFGSRFTVEWYQADEGRRARRPSRIDFALAHLDWHGRSSAVYRPDVVRNTDRRHNRPLPADGLLIATNGRGSYSTND